MSEQDQTDLESLKRAIFEDSWTQGVMRNGLETPSPIIAELRASHRQSERLTVWMVLGITGWAAFLAVIVVSAMR